jgi:hypothetical protein
MFSSFRETTPFVLNVCRDFHTLLNGMEILSIGFVGWSICPDFFLVSHCLPWVYLYSSVCHVLYECCGVWVCYTLQLVKFILFLYDYEKSFVFGEEQERRKGEIAKKWNREIKTQTDRGVNIIQPCIMSVEESLSVLLHVVRYNGMECMFAPCCCVMMSILLAVLCGAAFIRCKLMICVCRIYDGGSVLVFLH